MAALLSGGQEAPRHSKKNNGRGPNYAASAHGHYNGISRHFQAKTRGTQSFTAFPSYFGAWFGIDTRRR